MQKKQTSVSYSSLESEIIALDAGLRIDGLPALDLWDVVKEVLRSPNNTKTSIKLVSGNRHETGDCSRNPSKVKPKGHRDVLQLSQLNCGLVNAHSCQGESQLFIFEDNEAAI